MNNPLALAAISSGGTPFSPQYIPYNAPNGAQCNNPADLTCRAGVLGTVLYVNYQWSPLDNISLRPEFYHDKVGQRTGVKTRYLNIGLGWQHWFSPLIELRPEVDCYHALDAAAFNGDANAGKPPNKRTAAFAAVDVIVHF